ncbi:MAG: glycosyltransferase family 39 protein [Chloroflexi bacterium]|nr:glycosyltransferase family 39 protein [Chloroflexota bacterium]
MRLSRSTSHLLAAAGSVILVALLLYLPFRSASLDNFDSYNIVRALEAFNPARFQPHPPGYVLYVWLGRVALALAGDARLALTTLSAASTALACGLFFLAASVLFDRRIALTGLVLIIMTPLMWLNAEKALSDATGLCAQACGALLLALVARRHAPLWLAGAWIGVAAGFRPQAILGLIAGWLLLAGWLRAPGRAWLAGALAATLGALTWLLPTLAALNWNVGALRGYLSGAAGFVTDQESLFAMALTPQSIAARWQVVWDWSSRAVFGPQPDWVLALLGLGALVLVVYGILSRPGRSLETCQVFAWLLPQALVQVLFLNPELTRYLLALLFPAALLVAIGLHRLGAAFTRRWPRARALPTALALLFGGVAGLAALPLVQTLHSVPAPPDQLAAYLARRLPREQTLIVARQSYNALAYHLPDWQVRFADAYDPGALTSDLANDRSHYIVIADPEAIQPGEQHVQIETVQFTRDPQVHAKHAVVTANIYGLVSSLTAQDFTLPDDGTIRIGTSQDDKYLLTGWYRREDIGGVQARWIGVEDTAVLRVLLPPRDATLTLRAMSLVPDQTMALRCDDRLLFVVNVYQQWTDVSVALPAECAHPDQPTRLVIRPSQRRSPADAGASTDQRKLAVAIAEVRIR